MSTLKHYILPLLIWLVSCSGDGEGPVIQRINEINAFDVGNAFNSTDIRVTFDIDAIANIDEFRIIIIPASMSEGFSERDALRLAGDQYHSVPIISSETSYSLRLEQILDSNGNHIQNDTEYVIKVLMIGDGFNQLSVVGSNRIELSDVGIYDGYYEGRIIFRGDLHPNSTSVVLPWLDANWGVFTDLRSNGSEFCGDIKAQDEDVLQTSSENSFKGSKPTVCHYVDENNNVTMEFRFNWGNEFDTEIFCTFVCVFPGRIFEDLVFVSEELTGQSTSDCAGLGIMDIVEGSIALRRTLKPD